jgi:hypothetical protein
MVGGEAVFRLVRRIVVDDELDRVEHGDAAQRDSFSTSRWHSSSTL